MRTFCLAAIFLLGCSSSDTRRGGSGGEGGGLSTSSSGTASSSSGVSSGSTSASGGVAGNGGGGGNGGAAGGTAGGGGGAGGAGGGGGSAVGTPCSWGSDPPCPAGLYCYAPGCAAGTCELIPTVETYEYEPVCDCEGHIHWNASVAARFGVSVSHMGQCNFMDPINPCDVAACPPGMYCNKYVGGQLACPFPAKEICWGLPNPCNPNGDPGAYACGSASCVSRCEMMKTGDPWYGNSAQTCLLCDPALCFDMCLMNGMFGDCVNNVCVCN